MHFSCIHTFISLYSYIDLFWRFSTCLSPSLFLALVCCMAPKCKSTLSWNPLRFGASSSSSSSSSNPTPSHVRFHDDKACKDFSENFSWWGIHLERQVILSDFPILTFPLSSTVGVESYCVVSWSLFPPWSYRSFNPICTDSIFWYLILSLAFEVRAS